MKNLIILGAIVALSLIIYCWESHREYIIKISPYYPDLQNNTGTDNVVRPFPNDEIDSDTFFVYGPILGYKGIEEALEPIIGVGSIHENRLIGSRNEEFIKNNVIAIGHRARIRRSD